MSTELDAAKKAADVGREAFIDAEVTYDAHPTDENLRRVHRTWRTYTDLRINILMVSTQEIAGLLSDLNSRLRVLEGRPQ